MVHLTHSVKSAKESEIVRKWILIDLSGKVLGRIAPTIARILQGKHKVTYAPYLDAGDYVIAINAKKVLITGKKAQTKVYTQYSGYPGGLKRIPYETMLREQPSKVISRAVAGMLPKNKLRGPRLKRLFVYGDENHPYKNKIVTSSSSL